MGSIVSSVFGGGGSRSAPAPSSGGSQFTQSVIREAPGIEERKLELERRNQEVESRKRRLIYQGLTTL